MKSRLYNKALSHDTAKLDSLIKKIDWHRAGQLEYLIHLIGDQPRFQRRRLIEEHIIFTLVNANDNEKHDSVCRCFLDHHDWQLWLLPLLETETEKSKMMSKGSWASGRPVVNNCAVSNYNMCFYS